jgi:hypothetical protein
VSRVKRQHLLFSIRHPDHSKKKLIAMQDTGWSPPPPAYPFTRQPVILSLLLTESRIFFYHSFSSLAMLILLAEKLVLYSSFSQRTCHHTNPFSISHHEHTFRRQSVGDSLSWYHFLNLTICNHASNPFKGIVQRILSGVDNMLK